MELPLDKVQNLIDALNQLNKVKLTNGNEEYDGNYADGQMVEISKYWEMAADEVLTLKDIFYYKLECLTCPDTGPIKIPENLRVTDVRQVAALEGDPDREFIVALSFYFSEVSYSGFRVMSRDQIRKLVRGLDSGAKIGAENMPGSWDEEFDVGLMANSFRIHSGRRADVAAMKLLFGDSVGQTDYFHTVCDAADRANQKEVEESDGDDDE